MSGTTHQMFALLAGLWIVTLFPVSLGPVMGVLAVIAVMIGALTPDLDQPTADIWRRLIGSNHVGNIFRSFSGGHRHLTHSLIGIAAVGFTLHWITRNLVHPDYIGAASVLWVAFMIGYITHPIADTFTDWGVPWFWPLHFKVKIPPGPGEVRVTTGSFVELIIVRGGIIVAGVLLIQSYWQVIVHFFGT